MRNCCIVKNRVQQQLGIQGLMQQGGIEAVDIDPVIVEKATKAADTAGQIQGATVDVERPAAQADLARKDQPTDPPGQRFQVMKIQPIVMAIQHMHQRSI